MVVASWLPLPLVREGGAGKTGYRDAEVSHRYFCERVLLAWTRGSVDSLQLTVENSDSGVAVGKLGEKGIPYKVDRKKVENSECCRIPQSNTEFWIRKIQRNQERDQENYRILRENGWQVIVLWECQLKPKQLEQTMLRVEVQLHDYYLATFNPKDKSYIRVDEELPMAAEDMAEYNV